MERESNRKLAIEEIQHSLEEWGIKKLSSNPDHAKFRSKAIQQVLFCIGQSPNAGKGSEKVSTKKFPTETVVAAYEHVLRVSAAYQVIFGFYGDVKFLTLSFPIKLQMTDCSKDYRIQFCDSLGMDGFLEPYMRRYDRYDKSKVIAYNIKQEYKEFTLGQINPLCRFTYVNIPKEEAFFQEWFLVYESDNASQQGFFMEAALSRHLIKHENCHSCKYKNALRWSGGGQSSWQDLYCTVCFSTYEVKTKATTERVENAFKWNRISGGSYQYWCLLNNQKLHPQQKRFLVLLPRTSTYNRKRDKGKSLLSLRFH